MSDVGDRVRQVRLERRLTVVQLAKLAKLAQSTLSELENGDSKGSKAINRIAKALGIVPRWLETEKGPKYENQLKVALEDWSAEEFSAAQTFVEQLRARREGK